MFFYVVDIAKGFLEGAEAEHFFSMRTKVGDKLVVCDQMGTKSDIEITVIDKPRKMIRFRLISALKKHHVTQTGTLFQAITDKSYLEKMVEIAPLSPIGNIVLFASQFTPPSSFSIERLEKIIIRSCEQSERFFRPTLVVVDYEKVLEMLSEFKPLVLECDHKVQAEISNFPPSILVGPEGGWSSKELEDFKKAGLASFQMGSQIYPAWLAGYSYFTKFC
jgi:RsmE family RNA methyltransferase